MNTEAIAFVPAATRSGDLINIVVTTIQHSLKPQHVAKGGSEGKNTVVEGSDIDLAVVLNDYNYTLGLQYCTEVLSALADRDIKHVLETHYIDPADKDIPHGMKITVTTANVERYIDIQFTGDPSDNQYDNPKRRYAPFYNLQQVKYVREKKNEYPSLHQAIVELKTAIYTQVSSHITGYYTELVCIKHFEESGDSMHNAQEVLKQQICEKSVFTVRCPFYEFNGSEPTVPQKYRKALQKLRL